MVLSTLKESWIEDENGDFLWTVPAGWLQGRSLFGGLNAAAAAALASRFTDRRLRTMQAQLVGPIVPGVVVGKCRVLRAGKTVSFISVDFFQNDILSATYQFVYIAEREGSKRVDSPVAPEWQSVDEAISIPFIEGLTPEFTKNVNLKMAYGGIPFQGEAKAAAGGYVSYQNEKGPIEATHQLALLDAWFPPIFTVLDKPVFGSTVTWTAHLLADSAPGPHQFKYDTLAAEGGFSTSIGHMWDATGKYVAFTEQTVVVFD